MVSAGESGIKSELAEMIEATNTPKFAKIDKNVFDAISIDT